MENEWKDVRIIVEIKKVECHDIIVSRYYIKGASNLKLTTPQLQLTWLLLDWNFKCSIDLVFKQQTAISILLWRQQNIQNA